MMSAQHRILLVDDEAYVLQSLKRQLRGKFTVDTANGGQEALALMERSEQDYAVIVSDMKMPLMDGLQLLKEFRQRSPDTVRIMLTGNIDQKTVIDAVNQGEIFRFINKPCDKYQLISLLEEALSVYEDNYHLKNSYMEMQDNVTNLSNKITSLAQYDPVTGLPNRKSFADHVNTVFDKKPPDYITHCLCFISIDQFSIINEACGPDACEQCTPSALCGPISLIA